MKRIIKLTESDLTRIVRRVIMESTGEKYEVKQVSPPTSSGKYSFKLVITDTYKKTTKSISGTFDCESLTTTLDGKIVDNTNLYNQVNLSYIKPFFYGYNDNYCKMKKD